MIDNMEEVILKVIGLQTSANGEKDDMEFVTEGKFYNKNGAVYIVYKETDLLGIDGSVTTIKIRDNIVKMQRYGPVRNEMTFEKGEKIEGEYETPFGTMPMEILTNIIDNKIESVVGKRYISIEYDLSIKGLTESQNQLTVEIL